MLRQNPSGGPALKHLPCLDWDASYAGMQYKLGYCECGKKVLATPDQLKEIVNNSLGFVENEPKVKRAAKYLLRRLAE